MNAHPQNEDVAAYVEGGLSPEERTVLEAHLAECPECRRVATEAALLLREEARRRKWIVAAPAAALGAAAALALFVILPAGDDGVPTTATTRAGREGGREALPAIGIVLPDARPIHPDSVRFAWKSAAPGAFYRLAVTDSAGGAVWETTTSDTAADPPPEVDLEGDHGYFWYVDALLPDGSEASTGVQEFRTRGP